jgi:hypothetical protein
MLGRMIWWSWGKVTKNCWQVSYFKQKQSTYVKTNNLPTIKNGPMNRLLIINNKKSSLNTTQFGVLHISTPLIIMSKIVYK